MMNLLLWGGDHAESEQLCVLDKELLGLALLCWTFSRSNIQTNPAHRRCNSGPIEVKRSLGARFSPQLFRLVFVPTEIFHDVVDCVDRVGGDVSS